MKKYLRVTMPDGSRWDVPADVIAGKRAKFYSDIDKDTTFQKEFEYAMANDFELKDWASNNVNWDEVKSVAKKAELIPVPPVDYQDGWINGDKEILEY